MNKGLLFRNVNTTSHPSSSRLFFFFFLSVNERHLRSSWDSLWNRWRCHAQITQTLPPSHGEQWELSKMSCFDVFKLMSRFVEWIFITARCEKDWFPSLCPLSVVFLHMSQRKRIAKDTWTLYCYRYISMIYNTIQAPCRIRGCRKYINWGWIIIQNTNPWIGLPFFQKRAVMCCDGAFAISA